MSEKLEQIKLKLEEALRINQQELYSLRQKGVNINSLLLLEKQQKGILEQLAKCKLMEPMKPFVIVEKLENESKIVCGEGDE